MTKRLLTAIFLLVIVSCPMTKAAMANTRMALRVNGEYVGDVSTKIVSGKLVINAKKFCRITPQLSFFEMLTPSNPGIVLQFGDKISFVSIGFDTGFSASVKVAMDPPVALSDDGIYWVPKNFIEQACDGKITVKPTLNELVADLPPAHQIGDTIKQAADIAEKLESLFTIRQGQICLTNAIDTYVAGYQPDCNGNNANSPYLVTQNPISPRATAFNNLPYGLYMDQDEAFVWVGQTPPLCRYFSYQHYLMTRYYPDKSPALQKIYARLGDSINNQRFNAGDTPFNRFFVLIICSNQTTYDAIRKGVLDAGVASDCIHSLVIPNDMVKFGLDLKSDGLSFLHRATLFNSDEAKDSYIHSPSLEILRLTPKIAFNKNPMKPHTVQGRQTSVLEQKMEGLGASLDELENKIVAKYGPDYKYVKHLKTSTWMYPGGSDAIASGTNVLGETNDTLYLKSEEFVLNADDLIVVYGVNHEQTGKTVYSNVSCYGAEAYNGVGGITSARPTIKSPKRVSYWKSAEEFLPLDANSDKLYVYKFSRKAIDKNTYVLGYNNDNSFTGFNDGDTVFMGFRNYVDVFTGIGPYPGYVRDGSFYSSSGPADGEIFFDQAILFTNVKPE